MESHIQTYLIAIPGIVLLVLAGLWYLVPLLSGLPWIPARGDRIVRALDLARIEPGNKLYDLGAGDGRVLTIAAREYGATAIGVEISPVHCIIAHLRILFNGLRGRVKVRWGNFYRADFHDADVVFIYLTQAHANRVKSLLEEQLKSGARIVTLSSDLDGWEPAEMDSEGLIFLYVMPPTPGSIASFMAR